MPAQNHQQDHLLDGAALLRNEPVQARSTARLATLLDSAAAVIDEVGYERLTTAMVAERAGASIGTVYRYFPDRIVVLQGLSARYLEQCVERTTRSITESRHENWVDAVLGAIDELAAAFRTEPGFRSLRFGDVLDVRPALHSVPGAAVVASRMAQAVTQRFGTEDSDLAFRLDVAISLADALLARAFAVSKKGDEKFVTEAKAVARGYLEGFFAAK